MLKRLTLSSNALKIIACLSMLIDHAGLMLFPAQSWMRYVGRLAFPIFAFTISEGCRYTKNKLKYFLLVFLFGVVCQIAYAVVYPNDIYLGILITFSFSILLIYSLEFLKKSLFEKSKPINKISSIALFLSLVLFCYFFTLKVRVDYGFMGIMLPVICSLLDFRKIKNFEKVDKLIFKKICFTLGVFLYFIQSDMHYLTVYCLLTIPLIFLYNGSKGRLRLKYCFYAFYPLHLLILAGLQLIMN